MLRLSFEETVLWFYYPSAAQQGMTRALVVTDVERFPVAVAAHTSNQTAFLSSDRLQFLLHWQDGGHSRGQDERYESESARAAFLDKDLPFLLRYLQSIDHLSFGTLVRQRRNANPRPLFGKRLSRTRMSSEGSFREIYCDLPITAGLCSYLPH